jgi:cobalt-zinc-cadmium efflux system protein
LGATLVLVLTEFIAGHLAHSLALISDAWHNLTDVPSLVLAGIALYLERKPPDAHRTYGYQRAGVLAAFVNALMLLAVALFICYEGYERIIHPTPVATRTLLVVAVIALVINGGIALALAHDRQDLNLRAVFIHNLGDALSNVGLVVGALLIQYTGQWFIDPLLAFLIAGMIIYTAFGIITDSGNILLESLPPGMSLEQVAQAILRVPGVREVHDVHIWSLGSRTHALSCHVQVPDTLVSETESITRQIRELLARDFGIGHTTIQFGHLSGSGRPSLYMPAPAPAVEDGKRAGSGGHPKAGSTSAG